MPEDQTAPVIVPPFAATGVRERGRRLARHATTRVAGASWARVATLAVLAAGSLAGWYLLYGWYNIEDHRRQPHFAFEKLPGGFDSPILRQTAVVFLLISIAYVATFVLMDRIAGRRWVALLALTALFAGGTAACVLMYPVGALDAFNYMIEMKLAYHFDANPYITTFAAYRDDPYALPAFLVEVTLFYGPAWLLAMWVPGAVAGYDAVIDTLIAVKLFNVALLAAGAVLIARHQRDRRQGLVAATIFLANPLVLFEGVANAHNDVLLTVFVIGAMFALQRRSPLAGPLLALSALVKLYTVVLVPIFIVAALRSRWGWRTIALTVALTTLTGAAACAPWWGDGELIDGMRSGLVESQEMDHVSPLSLAKQYVQEQRALDSPATELIRSRPSFEIVPESTRIDIRNAFLAVLAVGTLAIAVSVWKGRAPELAAAETLLLLFLCTTNLYGWYLIPVIALLAMRPDRLGKIYVAVATTLALVYYPMFVYAHFNTSWTRFQVHQFLALFLTAPILLYLLARTQPLGHVVRRRLTRA